MANEFLKSVTDLLKSTEDKFTKSVLCHIGYDSITGDDQPFFCGVGECIHAVGYTCKQLSGNAVIKDFEQYENLTIYVDIQTKLIERFKVDFTQQYKYKIECHFCIQEDRQPVNLMSFESVINHINDTHVFGGKDAFGEIAEKLEELAKYYDLETGEYIYGETSKSFH